MDAADRREQMLRLIVQSDDPITGSELARQFSVSRQVIVQDIAILRAAGENIIATPQGYMIPRMSVTKSATRIFACKHDSGEKLEEELTTIVDLGGKVIDVIVEHPLYGEYRALLMLSSPAGVRDFLTRLKKQGAAPLSSLTGGIHLHTVEADSIATLNRIEEELLKRGILLREVN